MTIEWGKERTERPFPTDSDYFSQEGQPLESREIASKVRRGKSKDDTSSSKRKSTNTF